MQARLLELGEACRDDWQTTWRGTRVVLTVLAVLALAFAAFALWFVSGFRA